MAKLSAYCIACGDQHSREHMRWYVDARLKRGEDPTAAPNGGILCPECLIRTIRESNLDQLTTEALRNGGER